MNSTQSAGPTLNFPHTRPSGYSLLTGYDNRRLQTYARFGSPSGAGITNAWDGFGRLVSTWTNMDGTSRRLSSEFDADGRRTVLWDNGVSYTSGFARRFLHADSSMSSVGRAARGLAGSQQIPP